MAFGSPQWMYSSGGDYELEQSLRTNDDDSAYLSKTFASAGNRRTWTWSGWVKRGELGSQNTLFGAGSSGSIFDEIYFDANDKLNYHTYNSATHGHKRSTALYRDTSAWYHIVVVYDSTDSTAVNRIKLYVNGEQITDFAATTDPSQNHQSNINNNNIHAVGAVYASQLYNPYDGYLAEVNFIDGTAKAPADFGETGDYGEWKPKEYSGTYGTNGFYLPFKQDYTVEGFSTVTWKATSAPHYIGGVGFKPDLVWGKKRSSADSHALIDSVRGSTEELSSNATSAEATNANGVTSFELDGFNMSVGSGSGSGVWNGNAGATHVAWCWDMGADTPTGFGCVTYTGSGADKSISGFGFSPDFVWVKKRSATQNHFIFDTVRGTNKQLKTNNTGAETTHADYLEKFEPDGFRLGSDSDTNGSGATYVAWGWDMGGTTATNTSGSINSTVMANPTYGQSIVSYTGSSSASTVGHGLSSAPELVITKRRDNTGNWGVYHTSNGATKYQLLNSTEAAGTTTAMWNDTAPTNSVFSIGTDNDTNGSSKTYIAYCFHSVSGYSKFGSYTGNGSTTGPSVTTGFRPAFLMVKETVSGGGWLMVDATRNPLGLTTQRLNADTTGAEDSSADNNVEFTDTGFQIKTSSGSWNQNGVEIIYMAFAGGMDSISDYNDTGSSDSRVKASTTYGQSIVSYTGQSGAQTIGHGLSSAPEVVIVKNRSDADEWLMYHYSLTDAKDKYLRLDTTGTVADNTFWNDTAPTASVFSVGDNRPTNSGHGSSYIAYCFHSVAGYSKIGSYTGNGSTTGPTITLGFRPAWILLKSSTVADSWFIYDTTRNPGPNPINTYLQADQSADESSTALANIDILDTGFQLKTSHEAYNDNGDTYIYMAFADKREYAYWLDQSGNNNDWTSNNLTESDISVDSPTNNFATWNAVDTRSTVLAEGNLQNTPSGSNHYGTSRSTIAMSSGSWYAEFYAKAGTGNGNNFVGIATQSEAISGISNSGTPLGFSATSWGYSDNDNIYNGAYIMNSTGVTWTAGDIIGVTFNGTQIKFYKNNSLVATVTGDKYGTAIPSDTYCFATSSWSTSMSMIANFGQDSSFAGNKTAQGNQDSGGIGDFYYTPPTGFKALCTKNLPDVDVTPSEHFNTVLYNGSSSTPLAVTGVGFSPDMTWLKARSVGWGTGVFTRLNGTGAGSGYKYMFTNTTVAEDDRWGAITFDSDGFTGVSSSYNGSFAHDFGGNGQTFVSWNWKANGSGSSNTDGDITSTVSANVDAGFSLISYSGASNSTTDNSNNGGNYWTIGHGLSKAPELILVKRRDTAAAWYMGLDSLGSTPWTSGSHLVLSGTNAIASNANILWGNAAPNSSTFKVGGWDVINRNGSTYIAYCFHSVDGYSKVGSYTGNSSTDGTFIYTGFRPAFVMTKLTSTTSAWNINDNKRDAENPVNLTFKANESDAENSTMFACDFTSNGFKMRDSGNNNSTQSGIYIAFAETPFKYSNAR